MDRESLERLATDRALGGLTPEAGQLLEAYIACDPQAAAIVRGIDTTVQAARRVLREPAPSSLPAFPVAGFMQIERWRRRIRVLTYAGALAACVLLGVGLGRLHAPTPSNQPQQIAETHQPASPIAEANANPGRYASEAGFWSIERLRKQRDQMEAKPTRTADKTIDQQWRQALKPT